VCDAGCAGTSRLLEDDDALQGSGGGEGREAGILCREPGMTYTAERGWRRLQRVNGEASLHGGRRWVGSWVLSRCVVRVCGC